MSQTPIDILLPETFHRLKRTVLLFSAALVVLAIAEPASSNEMHLTLIDVKLSTALLRWLLWLAALYYLWGFYLEAMSAIRLNSDFVRSPGASSYEAAVQALANSLEQDGENLSASARDLTEGIGKILSDNYSIIPNQTQLTDVVGQSIKSASISIHNHLTESQFKKLEEDVVSIVEQNLKDYFNGNWKDSFSDFHKTTIFSKIKTIENTSNNIVIKILKLTQSLEKTSRRMSVISNQVEGYRRTSFFVWEVGGVAGSFLIATISVLPFWNFVMSLRVLA